jgi:predicted outer membrane lipoprotein
MNCNFDQQAKKTARVRTLFVAALVLACAFGTVNNASMHEKLDNARHNKLEMVQRNKLVLITHNRLVDEQHKKRV